MPTTNDRLAQCYAEADQRARDAGFDNDIARIIYTQAEARKRVDDLLRFDAEFVFKMDGREYPANQLVKTLAQEGRR